MEAARAVESLTRQVEHLQKASEQMWAANQALLVAVETLAERVDELERLAGLHGAIVLPPDVHLERFVLTEEGKAVAAAIEKADDRRAGRAGGR